MPHRHTAHNAVRRAEYLAYLNSEAWQAKRQVALERAGHRCQLCNQGSRLDVHHRTYERFGGDELQTDLTVLCRPCHDHFHAKPKPQRQKKRKTKGPAKTPKKDRVGPENERLHQIQKANKAKQQLVREGLVSPTLRAELAHRPRK